MELESNKYKKIKYNCYHIDNIYNSCIVEQATKKRTGYN